jgi:hypothetical protein
MLCPPGKRGLVLQRCVNPNFMTFAEWRRKRAQKGSFAAKISAQPKGFVLGAEGDLARG